ncbi:hypothetical protein QBC37DRAFT_79318 [Rhypophila decipiens]|uniref:Uncharacterized protein n=1 Tax=Rhypophila decipiens TaxID=261697 RepID=A0AAN6XXF8_9PEZI|nr:hypothetical protein QBC37DRAFT_79318 [Rhypophila decipiens]
MVQQCRTAAWGSTDALHLRLTITLGVPAHGSWVVLHVLRCAGKRTGVVVQLESRNVQLEMNGYGLGYVTVLPCIWFLLAIPPFYGSLVGKSQGAFFTSLGYCFSCLSYSLGQRKRRFRF